VLPLTVKVITWLAVLLPFTVALIVKLYLSAAENGVHDSIPVPLMVTFDGLSLEMFHPS
jgi:hypothetical protein